MNDMKKNYFLIIIVLGFFSCQKEISSEVSNTNTSTQVDVYVAGYVSDLSAVIPVYWKNGQVVTLPDGRMWGGAASIVVSGTDVYVAGYEDNGSAYVAKYWKNENPVNLPSDVTKNAFATSIAISGTDVYAAGYEYSGL